MLGVWLSRFGGRCLFDFGASNLVGSVFSNVSKGWACLLVYLAMKHRARPSKFMCLNFVSAVSLLFFYPSWLERCSRSCKLHVLNFGKVICGTHELLLRVGSGGLSSKIHVLSTSPEVFDRMPIISAKLSVHVTGADKAGKVGASSISEIGPRGL
ncbi:unnamed protein product [Malus baccata var. baccata]